MEILIVFLLAAHLLAMNLAGAGPLVSLYFEWREGGERGSEVSEESPSLEISTAGKAARWLTDLALGGYLFGMLIGGGLLTLVWSKAERGMLAEKLASKIFFGIWELAFSLALMILASLWWRWAGRGAGWSRWTYRAGCLLSATNLLYHFPMLFAVADHFVSGNEAAGEDLTSAAFRALAFSPEILSRAIHFILASFAACGVAVMVFAAREPAGEDSDDAVSPLGAELDRLTAAGAWIALVTTGLQPLIGWWVLFSLPALAQMRLTGGDGYATGFFFAGIAFGLGLLHPLFAAASDERPRGWTLLSVILFIVTVLCMTVTLRMAVVPS